VVVTTAPVVTIVDGPGYNERGGVWDCRCGAKHSWGGSCGEGSSTLTGEGGTQVPVSSCPSNLKIALGPGKTLKNGAGWEILRTKTVEIERSWIRMDVVTVMVWGTDETRRGGVGGVRNGSLPGA